jgi:hypothetical protein
VREGRHGDHDRPNLVLQKSLSEFLVKQSDMRNSIQMDKE